MGLLEIPDSNRPTEETAIADISISDGCLIEEVLRNQMQRRLSPRQREILERHIVGGERLVDLEIDMSLTKGRGQQILNHAMSHLKQSTELKGLKKLLP